MKNKYDVLICICVFLICIAFPFNLFIKNEYLLYGLEILMRVCFVVFILIYIKKKKIATISLKPKNVWWILPLYLGCFCNLYYLCFHKVTVSFDWVEFVLLTIKMLFVAVSEELLFRNVVEPNLKVKNIYLRILFSALIFSLFHIVIFLTTFNPFDLIILVYTLFLGLVLSIIYELTNSIVMCVVYHFLFNVVNDVIYPTLYQGDWDIFFILNAAIVVVVLGLYVVIALRKKIAKENEIQVAQQEK